MKYFSEDLKKFFDTAEACDEAEKVEAARKAKAKAAAEKKAKEKDIRKADVDVKLKAMRDAEHEYYEALEAYCKDYGWYEYHSKFVDNLDSLFFPRH